MIIQFNYLFIQLIKISLFPRHAPAIRGAIGCSVMTSSQIQDGGRLPIWKSLFVYLSKHWFDYNEIWYAESGSDCH